MMRTLWTIGLLLLAATGYSAFEDLGGTARGRAMGNAIFGDQDGVHSLSYNPATISHERSIQAYGAWDTPYTGLNDDTGINTVNFNIVLPFWWHISIPGDTFFTKGAAVGIQVHRFSVGGLDVDGSTPVEYYHEGIYSLTYAKNLDNVLLEAMKLSAGVRFSLYDIGVGQVIDAVNNPLLASSGKLSLGIDLGLTYNLSENLRLGLTFKNLLAPNVSILQDGTDTLGSEMSLGANWDLGKEFFQDKLKIDFLRTSKVGFGIVFYNRDGTDNRQADSSWNLGLELGELAQRYLVASDKNASNDIIKIRAGFQYQAKKVGDDIDLGFTKLKGVMTVTGGLGFNYLIVNNHLVSLDYGTEYVFTSGHLKHTVGLTYEYLLNKESYWAKNEDEYREKKILDDEREAAAASKTNASAAPTTSPSVAPTPKPTPKPATGNR